jgi:hypothetical protein
MGTGPVPIGPQLTNLVGLVLLTSQVIGRAWGGLLHNKSILLFPVNAFDLDETNAIFGLMRTNWDERYRSRPDRTTARISDGDPLPIAQLRFWSL